MASDDNNAIIEPTPFSRAEAQQERRLPLLKPIPIAVGATFLVLALFVAFMFTAKAVRFSVTPVPATLEITGGLPTWQLGERYLMLPGDYRLNATLEGYHPLAETITVGDADDQELSFEMEKLPGILNVTTSPPVAADVYVDQAPRGTAPLTIDGVPPGLRDISIVSERFLPFDTEVDIEGLGITQTIDAVLAPAWALVDITSMPEGTSILVDGEEAGTTPATLEILQGPHDIRLRRSGYKTWQTKVEIVAGEDQTLPNVRLERADGSISITTTPDGANVTIGGRYRGQTPLEVTLRPGESYKVMLSKAGFQTATRSIEVQPDEDIALAANLEPLLGVVRFMVEPDGGELFIDGKSFGDPDQRVELPARNHDVEIRKDGYATFQTTIAPKPGLAQQVLVALQTEAEAEAAAIIEEFASTAGPEFQLIIPDRLTMGAGRREPGRRSNEIEKDVLLTKPYYLSIHEVTNEQYERFNPNHEPGVLGRTLLDQDERPVVNISWQDAARYCNWLSEQDGLPPAYERVGGRLVAVEPMTTGYRLPTEAEWAWAARYAGGAEPSRFPWGRAMPPTGVQANYADESASNMVPYHIAGYNDTFRGPAPVGSFDPNEFGIYDLAGNVSEWIHDYYSIEMVSGQLVDPLGPAEGEYHVVRGSNYTHGRFSELRWTFRDYGDEGRPDVGFRIARYVE